jgi:hypothetical protein
MKQHEKNAILWVIVLVAICLVSLVVGCGGDKADPAAPEKCRTLIGVWCERIATCTGITVDDCRALFAQEIDCGDVGRVSESYDRCLSDLRRLSCQVLEATDGEGPKSCDEVLLVEVKK